MAGIILDSHCGEAAAAEIQRLLANCDYRLPEDKARELDRIFERARRAFR